MCRYAGCNLGIGAIPWRRTSAQVMDAAPAPEEDGAEQTPGSSAVLSHLERMRSRATELRQSMVRPQALRNSTTLAANQRWFRDREGHTR